MSESGKKKINKPVLLRLLVTVAGYGLLTAGVSQIYPPGGFIVAGILLSVEAWR